MQDFKLQGKGTEIWISLFSVEKKLNIKKQLSTYLSIHCQSAANAQLYFKL